MEEKNDRKAASFLDLALKKKATKETNMVDRMLIINKLENPSIRKNENGR